MGKLQITSLGLIALAHFANCGPSDPEPRPDEWWSARHIQYTWFSIDNPATPIVFYGDSITEGWGYDGRAVFDEHYKPLGVANYGISGDQVQNVLWRIINNEMRHLRPKVLVLKIGTNNLWSDQDQAIAEGIIKIVDTVRAMYPATKILLLGILPRNGVENFDRIRNINSQISRRADEYVVFHDMFDHFVESYGVVRPDLFYDGLHMWESGYRVWYEVMDPVLRQMLIS